MKNLLYQGLISLGIATVIASQTPALMRTWNQNSNLDTYFVVRQLEIDEFTMYGNDPRLYYDRSIFKDFSADWTATVQQLGVDGKFSYFCSGSDHQNYDSGLSLPKEQLTVSWITKNDPSCVPLKVTPGTYRLVIVWDDIDRGPYYLPTKLEVISNIFKILPEGVQLHGQAAAN